jgi:hypothetical protein
MNIYWYISKAKLDLLRDQAPGFLDGVAAKLSFKLPFVSGSLAGTTRAGLIKDLQHVIKRLRADYEIKSFAELDDTKAPVIVAFEGNATRRISDGVFWLAMQQGETGLLLAGSAGFAIGASSKLEINLSPSADPEGAVNEAFNDGKTDAHISFGVDYAWHELMAESQDGTLPRVTGLAFFARSVKFQRQTGVSDINRITIGTPIYVQQI